MLDYGWFVTLPLCLSILLILSPCSRVGPSHRLRSFGMSLLYYGFSARSAVTVRNLLQNGPFTNSSVVNSFSHFFQPGPLHELEGNICSTFILSVGCWRTSTFLGVLLLLLFLLHCCS